ncbi:sensor histidine kinase [Nonomuraea aurantiaca]|uniref:sensor histidine kinase n=1 Tax=Nonomuraea aurantiaca TaxID=2878562 RepID=UPI001CD9F997|nr:histidine kinase [Nonomuraea aurantiaca]MCA2225022.1 histidine kinase [Nonomuraea aurantiaca]
MNLIGAVVQLCALVVALRPRVPPAYSAVGGGAVSLAITAYHPLTGTRGDTTFWLLIEVPALLALTMLAARRAPLAALVPGLAVSTILLRMVWPGPPSLILAGCAGWSLGAVGVAAAGLYLRSLDGNRRRAVAQAVRDQRLALARDLHDFVAHDVSGMLVQAQAARLAPELPPRIEDALRRIEEGGQRALTSLDRTVHMLNEPARGPAPGIDGLRELADGFSSTVRVNLAVEAEQISREASATVYRVVTEALTNVRRHAPRATTVDIAVTRDGDMIHVRVHDDGGSGSQAEVGDRGVGDSAQGDRGDRPGGDRSSGGRSGGGRSGGGRFAGLGRKGGFGLAGLAEVLGTVGGSLSAGPHGAGWRVTATIPV